LDGVSGVELPLCVVCECVTPIVSDPFNIFEFFSLDATQTS
jgi:hypothetical protein